MRSPAYAGVFDGCKRIIPDETILRVSGDFDGDSKTDTAFAKRYGSSYRVEVHLSTKRGRIRLTVPVRNEVGLELIAYDVNQDNRADLILTSHSPIKPIAVWLNKGNGHFEQSSGLFGPFFGADGGPRFVRGSPRSDAQAFIPADEPAGDGVCETLAFDLETRLIRNTPDQTPPASSTGGSASPRGPPLVHYL
jgi:hypothetical protein